MKNKKLKRGFTLIEVLIVIGILAILAGIALVAINPARQFSQARDSQRLSHVNTILNAIVQNIAENKGTFTCNSIPFNIPTTATPIKSDTGGVNLYDCLVPKYIPEMPVDPKTGIPVSVSTPITYDTAYEIIKDTGSGRVTVSATAEIPENDPIKATK